MEKVEGLKKSREFPIQKVIEDYQIIAKYLAFVACKAKAPIRQLLPKKTIDKLNEFGAVQNIILWNSDQYNILSSLDFVNFAIIIGGNGVGKTMKKSHNEYSAHPGRGRVGRVGEAHPDPQVSSAVSSGPITHASQLQQHLQQLIPDFCLASLQGKAGKRVGGGRGKSLGVLSESDFQSFCLVCL